MSNQANQPGIVSYPTLNPPANQQPQYGPGPTHPPPPQGIPIAPPPGTAIIIVEEQAMPIDYKTCEVCHKQFPYHVDRCGTPWVLLILIIVVSIFVFPLLLLFLCFCDYYKVCPHCREFSGHGESNKTNIFLCGDTVDPTKKKHHHH